MVVAKQKLTLHFFSFSFAKKKKRRNQSIDRKESASKERVENKSKTRENVRLFSYSGLKLIQVKIREKN